VGDSAEKKIIMATLHTTTTHIAMPQLIAQKYIKPMQLPIK
jgi:hypothetical protein